MHVMCDFRLRFEQGSSRIQVKNVTTKRICTVLISEFTLVMPNKKRGPSWVYKETGVV
jgi:hypothetical protein